MRDPEERSVLIRLDTNAISDSDEIRLFIKVRNEAKKLPFFLSYYRSLGISSFFVIDNESTDDTVDLLCGSPDCHTFSTTEKLSEAGGGIRWIEYLLNQYGENRWCVVVDADELLVYPDSEVVSLPQFCHMLDQLHANAYLCFMLDMYPDGNIDEVNYNSGQSFIDACPYFDKNNYHWHRRKRGQKRFVGPFIFGGPRMRMFYPELLDRRMHVRLKRKILSYCGKILPELRPSVPITLNKIPLVRWNKAMHFSDPHDLTSANLARGSGALLHFKFLGDFSDHVKEEYVRKSYEVPEYRKYYERLHNGIPINFKCDMSLRFAGTRQLLNLGLIERSA
jgi:Glycosyl transferase family 2